MVYKTLLVILQSEADTPRVLDFALPFAARYNSHVIGLHAEALPIAMASPMGGPIADFSLDMEAEAADRHARLRAIFEERAKAEGLAAEWRGYESVSGDSAVSGIESARTADLVIVQQNDPDADSRMAADVEALIFESGRPVLLVPYTFKGRSVPFREVVLAWNGSKEASRAAFDALPLMKEAGKVEVLTVDARDTLQQDAGLAGAAIAASLARYGLDVTTRAEHSAGLSHGDVIANRLAETDADLLVMGAFGRSRLTEFVFGGVTRTMLQSMTAPVLMAR
ncbi:universal stress protein [Chelativorans xinjiangense]|uniref:universal stress protein n=1 Tax=Chelativorans xinjiangense TaxID=2681485 RepID=UPI00135B9E52|nr:universal stress protein [Chelativorans xinjiangense]